MSAVRRVGLVGCVKQKTASPRSARDLYTSALFLGRRRYVERSCSEWWILSALHGLVFPEDVLDPYDVTLKDAGRAERRDWSNKVLAGLDDRARLRPGDVVEIHAGSEYRDFGLVQGLRHRGVNVVVPAEGMPLGRQLAFYRDQVDG
ncbi:MAG: DUF6884 domain-containing protein [Dermatophilaceae bacterium]